MQKLYDVHSYEVRRYGVCGRVLLDRVGQATPPWHWSTPSFYYSREERRFYSRGAFRQQQGRGMGHIGDLEMTYATHEWNCGELLDQGGLLRGERGRANAGQRREGGWGGCGGAREQRVERCAGHAHVRTDLDGTCLHVWDFWLRQQRVCIKCVALYAMRTGRDDESAGE